MSVQKNSWPKLLLRTYGLCFYGSSWRPGPWEFTLATPSQPYCQQGWFFYEGKCSLDISNFTVFKFSKNAATNAVFWKFDKLYLQTPTSDYEITCEKVIYLEREIMDLRKIISEKDEEIKVNCIEFKVNYSLSLK